MKIRFSFFFYRKCVFFRKHRNKKFVYCLFFKVMRTALEVAKSKIHKKIKVFKRFIKGNILNFH